MRVWPDSLFGRTALTIAAALVIGQLTFLVLAHLSFSHLRVQQIAGLVSDEIRISQSAQHLMSPTARTRFTQETRHLGLHWNAYHGRAHPAKGPFAHALQSALRARDIEARVLVAGRGLVIATQSPLAVTVYVPGFLPAVPWPRIGFLLMGALLAGSGALLVVRRVNRPLDALTRAAQTFGRGMAPPPLPEDGPVEVRRVSRAFNQMIEDAHRYERDRALLLAGVSHDLRTPLARIRLAVELAGVADAELQKGMIQDIEEMDGILAEFLAYARHGVEEAPVPGNLPPLVDGIAKRYMRQGHAIQVHAEAIPPFPYRPIAMARLVANLVDNAAVHGKPPIDVAIRRDGNAIHIEVGDHGPGIPPARLAEIVTARDLNPGGRRGLGLAIARRIAEAHGGTLLLRNRPLGGLEALVTLPLPGADYSKAQPVRSPMAFKTLASGQSPVNDDCKRLKPTKAVTHNQSGEK